MRTKWLMYKTVMVGRRRVTHKVWFIVHPPRDLVTIDWVFTGKKHTVTVEEARLIWRGLHVMGFGSNR